MLAKTPLKRDYNANFGKIAGVLLERHSVAVPAPDLRLRFTLFMQEKFDAVPKEEWRLNDLEWLGHMEQRTKEKFLTWVGEQIKEKKG